MSRLSELSPDIFKLSLEELTGLVVAVFEHHKCFDTFSVDKHRFRAYVLQVARLYQSNPYHNFQHAVTVLHFLSNFLDEFSVGSGCSDIQIFSLLFAAVVHDVGHPGVNNAFEVESCSERALQWNDQSVLENYHAYLAFSILEKEDFQWHHALSAPDRRTFRRIVIAVILDTDMAKHGSKLLDLGKLIGPVSNSWGGETDKAEKLLSALLHSADLYTPISPWESSKMWSVRLAEEFASQYEQEVSLDMPPTASFTRAPTLSALAQRELGFYEYVMEPWWKIMVNLFPSMEGYQHTLHQNLQQWKNLAKG